MSELTSQENEWTVIQPGTGKAKLENVTDVTDSALSVIALEASNNAEVTDVTDVTDYRVSGDRLLNKVDEYLQRFVSFSQPHHSKAVTLWIAHSHAIAAFENTPRCAILSPEPGSGKSRLMELIEALSPRPVLSVNSSVAYIFRKISDEAGLPTLLLDEIDAVFSGRAGDGNEDLRGLLNSGYRRGATAGRAAIKGKEIVTEEWPSFCAVAMAGLNSLPDTLMTRSIIIPMKRRASGVKLEPYRRRVNSAESETLMNEIAHFASEHFDRLRDAWPSMPEGVEDRNADIWEPLLAIADVAGGEWPEKAREIASLMVSEASEKPATLGIRLLADIKQVFGTDERLASTELLSRLIEIETAPWANIKGEPIDSRFLARNLAKYEIASNKTIRIGDKTVKGFKRSQFAEAWDRYTPTEPNIGNNGNNGNNIGNIRALATEQPEGLSVTPVTNEPFSDERSSICFVCNSELLALMPKEMALCDARDAAHDSAFSLIEKRMSKKQTA